MILVVAANGENIFFLGEIIGDVEGKAGISAAVSAHQPTIDIYFRIVICAVEMQYRALPVFPSIVREYQTVECGVSSPIPLALHS